MSGLLKRPLLIDGRIDDILVVLIDGIIEHILVVLLMEE